MEPLPQPQLADPGRNRRLLTAWCLAVGVHLLSAALLVLSATGTGAAMAGMAGLFDAEPTMSVELVDKPEEPPVEVRPADPPPPEAPEPPKPPPSVASRVEPPLLLPPVPELPPAAPEPPPSAAAPPPAALPPAPSPAPAKPTPAPQPAPSIATVPPTEMEEVPAERPPGVNPGFGERPATALPGAPVRTPEVALAAPEAWYDFDAEAFAILLTPSPPARPTPTTPRTAPAAAPSLRMAPVQVQPGSFGGIQYPQSAAANRLEGDVMLLVKVDPDGTILDVRVAHSSGHADLDAAAVEGMRKAHFRVQRYSGPGRIVEAITFEAPVSFRLR